MVKLLRHAELPAAERYFSWFALFSEEAKAELLGRDGLPPTARVFAELLERAPAGLTQLGRLQYVDLRTMLAKDLLLKADRMSMAHSLELRVPLLDHEVVRAGLGLPDGEKVRGVETKARSAASLRAGCRQGSRAGPSRALTCRSMRGCAESSAGSPARCSPKAQTAFSMCVPRFGFSIAISRARQTRERSCTRCSSSDSGGAASPDAPAGGCHR